MCFGFIHYFLYSAYPHFFAADYTHFFDDITAAAIKKYRDEFYDRELGWSWRPGAAVNHETGSFTIDQQGSRSNGNPADPAPGFELR